MRIVAALTNPEGHDEGLETITLINTGRAAVALAGWLLIDRNGGAFTLDDETLASGASTTIRLAPNTCQLSNRGGTVTLADGAGGRARPSALRRCVADGRGPNTALHPVGQTGPSEPA